MEIKKIPISKINPAPYNPRIDLQPGDPEYEKIKKSITEFDLVEPLVWNKRTGNLIGGHQRLKVLQNRGDKEVEVSVVDLPRSKEKSLNIILNKVQGRWDLPKLKDLLLDLESEFTGFEEAEIDNLVEKYSVQDIDDLLKELNLEEAEVKPIWIVIRTGYDNRKIIESAIEPLIKKGIKIQRSYEAQEME